MARYTVYPGKFPCHTCKVEVTSLRLYPEIKEMTWMCKEGHISKVSMASKKKKDYEREK